MTDALTDVLTGALARAQEFHTKMLAELRLAEQAWDDIARLTAEYVAAHPELDRVVAEFRFEATQTCLAAVAQHDRYVERASLYAAAAAAERALAAGLRTHERRS